jgi:hypothetical protein
VLALDNKKKLLRGSEFGATHICEYYMITAQFYQVMIPPFGKVYDQGILSALEYCEASWLRGLEIVM